MDNKEKTQNPVVVKEFIANWYEKNKYNLEFNMWDYVYMFDRQEDTSFKKWFNDPKTEPFKTLVNMKQFGYKVKENKYLVKFKNVYSGTECLKYDSVIKGWYFGIEQGNSSSRFYHTKEELEEGGFGWVFNSPGIEVTEVEEG